jgi:hypothetical protein
VEEDDRIESTNVVFVAPSEKSVSSVSTDYALVKPTNIHSSTVVPELPVDLNANTSPVILSIDANDGFVAEPVTSFNSPNCIPRIISGTVPSTTTAKLDANSTVIHTVKAVKQKFVIVGGVVQRTPNIPKQEKISKLVVATNSHSPESLQESIASPASEKSSYPQRKKIRSREHIIHEEKSSISTASDGWTTDGELDETSTPSIIDSYRSDIYEMSINASPETIQVSKGITRSSDVHTGRRYFLWWC